MEGLFVTDSRVSHNIRRFSALLAVVAMSWSGSASAVDFKGVELGQTLWASTERSVFGKLDCNPLGLDPDEYQAYIREMRAVLPGAQNVCSATTSIATVPSDVTVVLGPSRRVLRMTFQFAGEHYERVVNAMVAKWGEGLIDTRDANDQSIWWDFEDGSSVSVHQTPGETGSSDFDTPVLVGLAEYSVPVTTPVGDL